MIVKAKLTQVVATQGKTVATFSPLNTEQNTDFSQEGMILSPFQIVVKNAGLSGQLQVGEPYTVSIDFAGFNP